MRKKTQQDIDFKINTGSSHVKAEKGVGAIAVLMNIFWLSLVMAGLVMLPIEPLNLTIDARSVLMPLILFLVLMGILMAVRRFRNIATLLILAVLMIWTIYRWDAIRHGMMCHLNALDLLINGLYGEKLFNVDIDGYYSPQNVHIALTTVYLYIGYIIYYFFYHFNKSTVLIIVAVAEIAGLLLMSVSPEILPLLFILGGCVNLYICTLFRKQKTGVKGLMIYSVSTLLIAAVSTLFLALSSYIIYPAVDINEQNIFEIKQTVLDIYRGANLYKYADGSDFTSLVSTGVSAGGMSYGNLRSAGSIRYSGADKLSVSIDAEPMNSVYLKGYGGSTYQNGRWVADTNLEYYSGTSVNMGSTVYTNPGIALMNIPYNVLMESISYNNEESYSLAWMEIDIRNSERRQDAFVPYGAEIGMNYDNVDDIYVNKNEEGTDYFQMVLTDTNFQYVALGDVDEVMNLFYRQYVYDSFLAIPEDLLIVFEETYGNGGTYSLPEAVSLVREILSDASYSLSPGSTPSNMDTIEYFLLENQKGYCMHFASSAALLMRYYGIPARYAEGYIIPQKDFYANDDGSYGATVTDSRAHAWIEVFNEEYGIWEVAEFTPAYSRGELPQRELENDEVSNLNNTDESESQSNSESESIAESIQESRDQTNRENMNTNDNEQKDKKSNLSSAIKYPIIFIVILLAFLLAILFREYILRRIQQHKIENPNRKEAILYIYQLEAKKEQFAGHMTDQGAREQFISYVEKAAYSQHEMTKEEYDFVWTYYLAGRDKLYKEGNVIQRLFYKYGLVL